MKGQKMPPRSKGNQMASLFRTSRASCKFKSPPFKAPNFPVEKKAIGGTGSIQHPFILS